MFPTAVKGLLIWDIIISTGEKNIFNNYELKMLIFHLPVQYKYEYVWNFYAKKKNIGPLILLSGQK